MNKPNLSEHGNVDELLPWYVNKTLDEREHARVERHLETCTACQENVRLWSQVQNTVRNDSPVPFVPEPNVDAMLNVVEADGRRCSASGEKKLLLVAASIMLAVAVAFTVGNRLTPETPAQFETVMSESTDNSVQYIIEIRFDENASPEQRRQILDAFGNVSFDAPLDADVLTLHLGAESLPELQERVDDVRALPYVNDAKIVAVHLPVD